MRTRLACMLRLGRCPHLTVTLLAQLARVSQGALLAQMIVYKFWNRLSIRFWTMLTRLDSMLIFRILWNPGWSTYGGDNVPGAVGTFA